MHINDRRRPRLRRPFRDGDNGRRGHYAVGETTTTTTRRHWTADTNCQQPHATKGRRHARNWHRPLSRGALQTPSDAARSTATSLQASSFFMPSASWLTSLVSTATSSSQIFECSATIYTFSTTRRTGVDITPLRHRWMVMMVSGPRRGWRHRCRRAHHDVQIVGRHGDAVRFLLRPSLDVVMSPAST